MPNPLEDLQANMWVLAALGRLARQGLLDSPAAADDALAVAAQRLLIAAGLLEPDPVRPSQSLLASLPPDVPAAAHGGLVASTLQLAGTLAGGDPAVWSPEDPETIRSYGLVSGIAVNHVLRRVLANVPGFPNRLDRPGAAFLDVGVGAAGISIELCRRHPSLKAVGLDINPPSVRVGRDAVSAAGLTNRIEVREQSVTEFEEVAAFDLIWVPQPFLPPPVLVAALPRLHRSARPGAVVVMGLAHTAEGGLLGAAGDVQYLMLGGGRMSPGTAGQLLEDAGFLDVRVMTFFGTPLMVARRREVD
ncbi:Methyltransferase domain-containing protein [Micromonospora rhizosphaerae]|uniref:Methyltransferase domain-containing protein n=1 Tax=Micromonospora rhizosphaerae TaxID=568872 RepID=A0A1C6SVX6_9ACTN|nr:class I SAM-dependent methyltransferase [Micromonospora rhizosphaerae]SCL33691.1 Methyltransferase domain-containing protein [Micromonospora rhizosphaerae]